VSPRRPRRGPEAGLGRGQDADTALAAADTPARTGYGRAAGARAAPPEIPWLAHPGPR
jgi:hypothetical protein